MVVTDFTIPPRSSSEMVLRDAVRIPIAAAISSNALTFMPAVKFSSESCNESKISETLDFKPLSFFLSNRFEKNSLIDLVAPDKLLVASTIFLPTRMPKIVPSVCPIPIKLTFSFVQETI